MSYECRVCFESGDDRDDFIVPCKCGGSSKYIHHKCLDEWLSICKSVNCKDECITCKAKYVKKNSDSEARREFIRNIAIVMIVIVMIFIFICLVYMELKHILFYTFTSFLTLVIVDDPIIANDVLLSCFLVWFLYLCFAFNSKYTKPASSKLECALSSLLITIMLMYFLMILREDYISDEMLGLSEAGNIIDLEFKNYHSH